MLCNVAPEAQFNLNVRLKSEFVHRCMCSSYTVGIGFEFMVTACCASLKVSNSTKQYPAWCNCVVFGSMKFVPLILILADAVLGDAGLVDRFGVKVDISWFKLPT